MIRIIPGSDISSLIKNHGDLFGPAQCQMITIVSFRKSCFVTTFIMVAIRMTKYPLASFANIVFSIRALEVPTKSRVLLYEMINILL